MNWQEFSFHRQYLVVAALLSLPFFSLWFPRVSLPPKKVNTQRDSTFDFFKGISILGVIGIHTFFILEKYHFDESFRSFGFVINNHLRFGVPFFFILSGLLLPPFKKEDFFSFYKTKILRIFLPYCFVSLYILWGTQLDYAWYYFRTGYSLTPYYFIIHLFQFYLVYPLLSRLNRYRFFLPLTFILSLLAYLSFDWMFIFQGPFALKFLFFFVFGMTYRDRFLEKKVVLSKGEVLFWGGHITLFSLIHFFKIERYYNDQFFYAPALFLFLINAKELLKKSFGYKFFVFLGKISLWIFYFHYLFMEGLLGSVLMYFSSMWMASLVLFISCTLLSIISSFLVANLYEKLLQVFQWKMRRSL